MDLEPWQPYVAAMEAYDQGRRDAIVVVYDDFERDEVPISYFYRGPDEFAPYERQALELCRGRVLDIGAGSGCHSLVLQQRGLEVIALEIDPGMARILRARGARSVRTGTWMDVDEGSFDTVLMMMNGIGLTETLTGLRRFFARARRLLTPNGQILADSTDVRTRMDVEAGGAGRPERRDGRYIGELHFQLEFEGLKGTPFRQLYADPETLARYAREGGWGCEIVREPDQDGHYLARLTP